jgi:hypothetical protein
MKEAVEQIAAVVASFLSYVVLVFASFLVSTSVLCVRFACHLTGQPVPKEIEEIDE